MPRYTADFHDTASTSTACGFLGGDATRPRRIKLYDVILSSEATPADAVMFWNLQRGTVAPTATGVTAVALDPADIASEQDALENSTADGTLTAGAFVLSAAVNQRATFRWVAAPGSEIVTPATAGNGIYYTFVAPTPGSIVTAQSYWEE